MAKAKARVRKEAETPAAPKEKGPRAGAVVPREGWTAPGLPPSPFALMRRLADEMDRLFGDFRFGAASPPLRIGAPWEGREAGAWLPNVEVAERGGNVVVRADLPGLTKDDVKVEVRDDAVCIEGERRQEREEKKKGLYRSERSYGRFYRAVPLPEGVDPEQAKASFKNGVLEVTMPAPPRAAKGRRLSIEGA